MKKDVVAGIDIGGTSVKIGFFSMDGSLLEKWSINTKKEYTKEQLIENIAISIRQIISEKFNDGLTIKAAGAGVPGSVNEDGIVAYAPNVNWEMFDAAGCLKSYLNVPVSIQNDANTAALGELKSGSAKGKSSICFITLGTGVGGGLVVNDTIITGFSGCGGEIGHMTVNPYEKEPCNCGRCGCLEQYASATGIARLACKYMKDDTKRASKLFTYKDVTAKEVFDCVKDNDVLAVQIAEQFGQILGRALSNVACLFNPEVFVIGGGVSNAGDILVEYVQKYFVQNAYSDCVKTEFKIASLGNDAGIYGGCHLALSLLK